MQKLLVLAALFALAGCATNFEPTPLPSDHPASVQAPEAPRARVKRLSGADELTRRTNSQLARKDAPTPNFESGGMSHDMGGMDHSKMQGMEMKDQPSSSAAPRTDSSYWTCVMHPEIHEDKPGQCPKCGMTLVKKEGVPK